jgi:Ca-activated chloride channel family protein
LQFGFRPADPSVAVGAPIIPENGVDPTQPQTLLEVPNIDAFRAVQQTWVSNKKRVDVLVVLDVSGSMQEEGRLENAKIALRSFVNRLDEQDGFGFVTFSTSATLVSPLEPIGPKRDEMINRISGLAARGNTRLVDTVREAYALLEQEPAGSRIRALIVLSDGADNRSEPGSVDALLNQLQSEVEGTSIKIFTIAYGSGADVNLELLELISDASGARTYESSPTEIEEIYEAIATFF